LSMRRNLLAGFANSIWSALIGLAVVPLYLKYLGIEAYGLVGFFATMQGILQLFDMGLAPTINREVARQSAMGSLKEAGRLLHTLAIVYWCVAVIIAMSIVSLAPIIARYWLHPKNISQQTVEHAVMLMGLIVACHWPIALYQGALLGAQRLTISSGINVAMSTLSSLGAVAMLAFVSPRIEVLFLWQAGVGLIYTVTLRVVAWRVVGKTKCVQFDFDELKRIWSFSVGMCGITVTALLFTNLDKIILSKMLDLREFGYYMLATNVVASLYFLIMPIYNVMYPRLSALVANEDTGKLKELYSLSTRLLSTLLFPLAMLLVVCSEGLLRVWTGNPVLAQSVAPVVSLLAVGTALHGVMFLPYALQLAYGMTRLPLMINLILVIIMVPLIVFFAIEYGALGGAMAWLVLHVLYVMLGTMLTHRYLLKGMAIRWLFQDVGIPLYLSLLAGLIGHYLIKGARYSVYMELVNGGGLAIIVFLISCLVSSKLRLAVQNGFRMDLMSLK
jgi:O-antigen/teichoic acid export membrane protein